MHIFITLPPNPRPGLSCRISICSLLFKANDLGFVESYFYCIKKGQGCLEFASRYLHPLLFPAYTSFLTFTVSLFIFSKISLSLFPLL